MKKILFILLTGLIMFSCSSDEEYDTYLAELIAGSYEVSVSDYTNNTEYDTTLTLSVESSYLNLSFDGKNFPINFNGLSYDFDYPHINIDSNYGKYKVYGSINDDEMKVNKIVIYINEYQDYNIRPRK